VGAGDFNNGKRASVFAPNCLGRWEAGFPVRRSEQGEFPPIKPGPIPRRCDQRARLHLETRMGADFKKLRNLAPARQPIFQAAAGRV
jgi:hypothetical protein